MNPGPSVPTAVAFACGCDQSSDPQAQTSTAVRSRAQARATEGGCRLHRPKPARVHTSFTAGARAPDRMRRPMSRRVASIALASVLLPLLTAASAFAHGFSSVVFVDATSPERGHVRTVVGLEYDLLVVSAAD